MKMFSELHLHFVSLRRMLVGLYSIYIIHTAYHCYFVSDLINHSFYSLCKQFLSMQDFLVEVMDYSMMKL